MTTDSTNQPTNVLTRRAILSYMGREVMVPASVAGCVSVMGILISHNLEKQHKISVSVIRSDKATPPEEMSPEEEFILGYTPTPVPPPAPNDIYTYTIFIRNSGDFPEDKIVISVRFFNDLVSAIHVQGMEVDASSALLSRTVIPIEPIEPLPSFAFTVSKMNPEEWISLKTSWRQAMRTEVDVRSNEITRSIGE